MAYMVMETHPAFAVVLDEEGKFTKVANMGYDVGEMLGDVIPIRMPPAAKKHTARNIIISTLAAAACFCLVFFGAYQPNFMPHGTVRVQINPDVLMTVSKTDRVLRLEGLNEDGETLIENYDYKTKKEDIVTAELVARAHEMGFLSDGGEVNVTIGSDDPQWYDAAETDIVTELENRLYNMAVTIYLTVSGEEAPHLILSTAAGSGDWQSWDDYGEYTEDKYEQMGEAYEQWGEQIGEAYEQWGEETGEQFEEKFGDEDYWEKFANGGVSQGDIDGLINDIQDILGR